MLLTPEEIELFLEGVWSGKYDENNLPDWIFDKLSSNLLEGANIGWGGELGLGVKDIALETALKENIFYFAAHKEAHELKELHQLAISAKNKYEFLKQATAVDKTYNYHWLSTEYSTTARLARSGREWLKIEDGKDIFPMLKFIAVQDGNTRAAHLALNGVIKAVDDIFWTTHFPPLDFGCRCRTKRLMEGKETDLEGIEVPPVNDIFAQRVTDSKKIWNDKHPYFSGLTAETEANITTLVKTKL